MKRLIIALLSVLFVFTACAPVSRSIDFIAMDTVVSVTVWGDYDGARVGELLSKYDEIFSGTNTKSELFALNEKKSGQISPDLLAVAEKSLEISRKTGGAFDITLGEVSAAWDIANGGRIPSVGELKTLLADCGYEKVNISGDVITFSGKLDFGGVAKGYIADKIADDIESFGVKSAIISLGGNVRVVGKKPDGAIFSVGITDPQNPGQLCAVVDVEDCSVITSGAYQRNFSRNGVTYHHIIDPKTGYPASGLKSVTIISKDGILADALSTALFVMGEEGALDFFRRHGKAEGFEVILVTDDARLLASDGIKIDARNNYKLEVIENYPACYLPQIG